MAYVLEAVPLSAVLQHGKSRYNDSNHWEGAPPHDYRDVGRVCDTRHWASRALHVAVSVPRSELAWLRDAARAGCITKAFPRTHAEELDEACARHAHLEADLRARLGTGRWFVRSEGASLKYGVHGAGPYTSLRQVFESVVTCPHGHTPLQDDCPTLYFFPWNDDICLEREFRVFVHQRRVTAISVQNVYAPSRFVAAHLAAGTLQRAVLDPVVQCAQRAAADMAGANWVMDIAVGVHGVYFIEPNPFGALYSSGSAAFHWLHDADKLCGGAPGVHVRYITDE